VKLHMVLHLLMMHWHLLLHDALTIIDSLQILIFNSWHLRLHLRLLRMGLLCNRLLT
jgi:hypothetical protein